MKTEKRTFIYLIAIVLGLVSFAPTVQGIPLNLKDFSMIGEELKDEIECDDFWERETCAVIVVKSGTKSTKITISGRRLN